MYEKFITAIHFCINYYLMNNLQIEIRCLKNTLSKDCKEISCFSQEAHSLSNQSERVMSLI